MGPMEYWTEVVEGELTFDDDVIALVQRWCRPNRYVVSDKEWQACVPVCHLYDEALVKAARSCRRWQDAHNSSLHDQLCAAVALRDLAESRRVICGRRSERASRRQRNEDDVVSRIYSRHRSPVMAITLAASTERSELWFISQSTIVMDGNTPLPLPMPGFRSDDPYSRALHETLSSGPRLRRLVRAAGNIRILLFGLPCRPGIARSTRPVATGTFSYPTFGTN